MSLKNVLLAGLATISMGSGCKAPDQPIHVNRFTTPVTSCVRESEINSESDPFLSFLDVAIERVASATRKECEQVRCPEGTRPAMVMPEMTEGVAPCDDDGINHAIALQTDLPGRGTSMGEVADIFNEGLLSSVFIDSVSACVSTRSKEIVCIQK